MSKLRLAVYDDLKSYGDRFVNYIVEHKSSEIECFLFRNPGKPEDLERFDLVIAKEEWGMTGENVFQLGDNRYGSVEELLKEATESLKARGLSFRENNLRQFEIIGIGSVFPHEMQEAFSIVTADFMGKKRKTLFINLEENSIMPSLLETEAGFDLGDVFQRLMAASLTEEYLRKAILNCESFQFINPFSNPEDAVEVTGELIAKFIEFVSGNTDFECMVIDMGYEVSAMAERLELADKKIILTKQGYFYIEKGRGLEEFLRRSFSASESFSEICLPYSAKGLGPDAYSKIFWSDFARYVREKLEEEIEN